MKICRPLCAAFVALALTLPVQAVTTHWNNNSGGSFTTATNWGAGVPLVNDTAVFDRNLNIQYNVTFPGRPILTPVTREVHQLVVGSNAVSFSDSVNFDQLPANFSVDVANTIAEGALTIGNTVGNVNATLNTTLSNFSASSVVVGNIDDDTLATSTLNINGGTFNVTGSRELSDELIIGAVGSSLFSISGGAHVNVMGGPHANAVIGRGGLNTGATVSGAGSALSISGGLSLGEDFFGTLTVENGGQLTCGDTTMGKFGTFSIGQVIVRGAGSTWTNTGDIVIGQQGRGQLSVATGGQIITSGNAYLGQSGGSEGTAYLSDGTMWTINGDMVVGHTGSGASSKLRVFGSSSVAVSSQLTVEATGIVDSNANIVADIFNAGVVDPGDGALGEAALHVDGSYTQAVTGALKIDLGGTLPGTSYDQLLVNGPVSLNGTLQVEFGTDYSPNAGDFYNVLDWTGSPTGAFSSLQLPALYGGLSWNISQLYLAGTLSVGGVLGDYNGNGIVDAADFTVWRNSLGQTGQGLAADGNNSQQVDSGDYAVWKTHFGELASSGSASESPAPVGVPEPTALALSAIAGLATLATRRR